MCVYVLCNSVCVCVCVCVRVRVRVCMMCGYARYACVSVCTTTLQITIETAYVPTTVMFPIPLVTLRLTNSPLTA